MKIKSEVSADTNERVIRKFWLIRFCEDSKETESPNKKFNIMTMSQGTCFNKFKNLFCIRKFKELTI